MASPKNPSDDHDLWAEVTKSVTPAKRDDVLFAKALISRNAGKNASKLKNVQKQVGINAPSDTPFSKKPDYVAPADLRSRQREMRAGIDNASARRLTKGSFEIDGRIDLHGKTEAVAHKALSSFILQASSRGDRTLLVITGKGAQGQGVLRRKVPEWLKDYPLKSHILAISHASPKDGGGGALYVRLRRARDQMRDGEKDIL